MSSITDSRAYLDALTIGTAKQIADAMGPSFAQREYEKYSASTLAAQALGLDDYGLAHARDFAALQSMASLNNAVKEMTSLQSLAASLDTSLTAQSIVDAFGSKAAMREYTKALDLTSQLEKLTLPVDKDYFRREARAALDGMTSATSSLEREYEKARASFDWANQLSKSLVDENLYKRFLNTLDIRHAVPSDMWSSAAEAANLRYEKLFMSPEPWASQIEKLLRPAYLDTLLSSIESDVAASARLNSQAFVEEGSGDEDEAVLQALAATDTPERFAELLASASKFLKWAIVGFLLTVVWPFMLSVSSNIATPYIEQYLKQSTSVPQKVQAKEIKKISMGEMGAALKDCRFVTAAKLTLRQTPKSRAMQVDTLRFGQVVTVISVTADWTEVSYEYGDGQVVQGWVFTRYLSKFRS